jgi:predicted nucleic acid-binding protein
MPEKQYNERIVISDTSCLIGLANIGFLDVLRQLFETVTITPEIAAEYGEPLPPWICIQTVSDTDKTAAYNKFLDLGESSAIALAMESDAALLIVDDLQARKFAVSLGLEITGTLGILIRAYDIGLITEFDAAISRLKKTGFHLPANIDLKFD